LPTLVRQVEGKIYDSRFDDLNGWVEEEDLPTLWAQASYTALTDGAYYSSPYSLLALTKSPANAGNVSAGQYLRRKRTVTIPAGVTSVRMRVRHRWHAAPSTMGFARRVRLGDSLFLDGYVSDAQDVWLWKNDVVNTSAGDKDLRVGVEAYTTVYELQNNTQYHWFDDIVVCRSGSIKVTNLATGYKAKLLDASDALIVEATESGGTATLDVSTNSYPITGRFKIYDGGNNLVHTSELSTDIYGGDEYLYGESYSIAVETDNYIINRQGASSPTSATVTFTLKDEAGSPAVGKAINFTTSHGTLNPTSGVTGDDGKVSTTLTATTMGVAVVKGEWPGTDLYPRIYVTIEVSLHRDADSPDSDKEYDVWIQGRKIWDCTATRISSNPAEDVAELEIPYIDVDVKGLYDFAIYRYGTELFFGRIEVLTKRIAPTPAMKLQGRTMVQALMRTHIESASFTNATLKSIIEQIHSQFLAPFKQVLLGTISQHLENISVTLSETDQTAYDLLSKVAALGAATVSVDADRKMHVR